MNLKETSKNGALSSFSLESIRKKLQNSLHRKSSGDNSFSSSPQRVIPGEAVNNQSFSNNKENSSIEDNVLRDSPIFHEDRPLNERTDNRRSRKDIKSEMHGFNREEV